MRVWKLSYQPVVIDWEFSFLCHCHESTIIKEAATKNGIHTKVEWIIVIKMQELKNEIAFMVICINLDVIKQSN